MKSYIISLIFILIPIELLCSIDSMQTQPRRLGHNISIRTNLQADLFNFHARDNILYHTDYYYNFRNRMPFMLRIEKQFGKKLNWELAFGSVLTNIFVGNVEEVTLNSPTFYPYFIGKARPFQNVYDISIRRIIFSKSLSNMRISIPVYLTLETGFYTFTFDPVPYPPIQGYPFSSHNYYSGKFSTRTNRVIQGIALEVEQKVFHSFYAGAGLNAYLFYLNTRKHSYDKTITPSGREVKMYTRQVSDFIGTGLFFSVYCRWRLSDLFYSDK